MSLLLKALQRASKSREGLSKAVPESGGGLTLEIEPGDIEPPRPPKRDLEMGTRGRIPGVTETGPQDAAAPRGGGQDRFDVVEWVRDHPVHVFAGAALVFLVGYFIYVYIAINNPGLFTGAGSSRSAPAAQPRMAPRAPEPVGTAQPPEPAPAPMPSVDTTAAPGAPSPTAAMPALPAAAAPVTASPSPPAIAAPAPDTGTTPPQGLTTADPPPAVPAARPPRRATGAVQASRPHRASVESVARIDAPLQEGVQVRATDAGTATQGRLTEAYDALQQRDLGRAQTLYESVIAADDRNIDGLLGLAATSWQQGKAEQASDHYYRVLQLDPQNAAAQAGLIGLSGQVDPIASESRLKQLIARDPSALLYASLGNLYASQGQWSNGQQAYFQAYQLEPANPDYAYNLAVGLEHVGQRSLAVGYYRKALDLARSRGRAGFDTAQVTARVAKLSAAVE